MNASRTSDESHGATPAPPDFLESVAGEEDPGASVEAEPGAPRPGAAPSPAPAAGPAAARAEEHGAGEDDEDDALPPGALFRLGCVAGALASLASTAVLALEGRRHTGSLAAATNATSHWVWGDRAFLQARPSWRHTGLGYLIHHSTATFWAFIYAWVEGARLRGRSVGGRLLSAGLAAATACLVDYTVTPRRLTPGFEHHLPRRSMALVYALFAVGLAVGCWWAQPRPAR